MSPSIAECPAQDRRCWLRDRKGELRRFCSSNTVRAMQTNRIHNRITYVRCQIQALGDKLAAADYANLSAQLDALEKQPIYPGFKARYLFGRVLKVERQFVDVVSGAST